MKEKAQLIYLKPPLPVMTPQLPVGFAMEACTSYDPRTGACDLGYTATPSNCEVCEDHSGPASRPGPRAVDCSDCAKQGQCGLEKTHADCPSYEPIARVNCVRCHGDGKHYRPLEPRLRIEADGTKVELTPKPVDDEPCPDCAGTGWLTFEQALAVLASWAMEYRDAAQAAKGQSAPNVIELGPSTRAWLQDWVAGMLPAGGDDA